MIWLSSARLEGVGVPACDGEPLSPFSAPGSLSSSYDCWLGIREADATRSQSTRPPSARWARPSSAEEHIRTSPAGSASAVLKSAV